MSRKKLVKTHIPTVNPAISETEKPFTEWTPEYINNYLKKEIPDINSVCQNTPELAKELMKKTTYQFCGMRAQYIKKLNEKENFPSENQMKKLNHITIFIDGNTLEAIVNLSKAKMERLLEELLEPDETSIWEDADWIFEIENVTKNANFYVMQDNLGKAQMMNNGKISVQKNIESAGYHYYPVNLDMTRSEALKYMNK